MCVSLTTKKNPAYGTNPTAEYMISYPCGKCPLCIKKRLSNWIFRIEQMQRVTYNNQFITLTYDRANIKYNMEAQKRDIQNFIKRLRKNQASATQHDACDPYSRIKYICVSEHGSKGTKRVHFHLLMFNAPTAKDIHSTWGMGYTSSAPINERRIKYVFKYVQKDAKHRKNFQLTSKGIGANYLTAQVVEYHNRSIENCYIRKRDGYTMSIPKYYKDKIYNEEQKRKVTAYLQQFHDETSEKITQAFMVKKRVTEETALRMLEQAKFNAKFDKRNKLKL